MEELPTVEYAYAMTPSEIENHNNYLKSLSDKLKTSASDIFRTEFKKLIDLYHQKESEIKRNNLLYNKQHKIAMEAYNSDKCICGSDLFMADGIYGLYWQCLNFRNKSVEHNHYMNYKENDYPKPKLYQSDIPKNYLFEIIRENGYKGKVNAKALLAFYQESGLQDLKEKYLNKSSSAQINTYIEVKRVSDAFESECLEILSPLYTTVKSQFHIKYKLKDGKPNQVAKLDFVCSNEKEVVIFECKTNIQDQSDDQKLRYIALINFINKTDRPVLFYYLLDTDRDCEGFKVIDRREMWVANGRFFGYPECCIDSFLNKEKSSLQTTVSYNTGFIPCIVCVKKLVKPRDIELLLVSRRCKVPFPGGGINDDYGDLHRQNVPEYYQNFN